MRSIRRRSLRGLAVVVATLVALVVVPASPATATPYCGITWGSGAKSGGTMTVAPITNLRAGRQTCFDRLVVDLGPGTSPGYLVRYVAPLVADPSGHVVALRGGADLEIIVRAPAYGAGGATYRPSNWREAVNVAGFRTFRQVAFVSSYEGQSQIGLGVRARLPFRVIVLRGPGTGSRLVIDVAHAW